MPKPINDLKKLLGMSSAAEVAEACGISKDTAHNINSGRGSENLITSYIRTCEMLKAIPADKRRSFFNEPKKVYSFEEKMNKADSLRKRLSILRERVKRTSGEAEKELTRYLNMLEEYEKLTKI
jgi:DNA-binding XRE family transcriptional regulator